MDASHEPDFARRALEALLPRDEEIRKRWLARLPRELAASLRPRSRASLRDVFQEELVYEERKFAVLAGEKATEVSPVALWERCARLERARRTHRFIATMPMPWPWWLQASGRTVQRAAFECGVYAMANWVRLDGRSFVPHGSHLDAKTSEVLFARLRTRAEEDVDETFGPILAGALERWRRGSKAQAAGLALGLRILASAFEQLPETVRRNAARATEERLTRSSIVRHLKSTPPLPGEVSARRLRAWLLQAVQAVEGNAR